MEPPPRGSAPMAPPLLTLGHAPALPSGGRRRRRNGRSRPRPLQVSPHGTAPLWLRPHGPQATPPLSPQAAAPPPPPGGEGRPGPSATAGFIFPSPPLRGSRRDPLLSSGRLGGPVGRAGAAVVPPPGAAWARRARAAGPARWRQETAREGEVGKWSPVGRESGGPAGTSGGRKANPSLAPGAGYGGVSWRSSRTPVDVFYVPLNNSCAHGVS